MARRASLVVFATGDLAIPVVDSLLEAGHSIARVVARAPRQDEDGVLAEERQGSVLARWAKDHDLAVSRPSRPGSDRFRSQIEEDAPDLGVLVSYGRRLPPSLLDVPKRGWLKVHFSLLPKYRGLHAIRAALWHADRQTGVTVIEVTEEVDAGPIVAQERLDVGPDETFGELAPRMAALAAEVVLPAVRGALGSRAPKKRKQNEKSASASPRFGARHLLAPWWREAKIVYARLRAVSPEPGMTTLIRGERVRVLAGVPANHVNAPIGETGSYIGVRSGGMAVLCGHGTVFSIERVQPENGEPIAAAKYAAARELRPGDRVI